MGSTLALNPGQMSPEVQNRGVGGPTKRTYVFQKFFQKKKEKLPVVTETGCKWERQCTCILLISHIIHIRASSPCVKETLTGLYPHHPPLQRRQHRLSHQVSSTCWKCLFQSCLKFVAFYSRLLKPSDLSSHCGVCLWTDYFLQEINTRWLTRLISNTDTRWLSFFILDKEFRQRIYFQLWHQMAHKTDFKYWHYRRWLSFFKLSTDATQYLRAFLLNVAVFVRFSAQNVPKLLKMQRCVSYTPSLKGILRKRQFTMATNFFGGCWFWGLMCLLIELNNTLYILKLKIGFITLGRFQWRIDVWMLKV